MVFISGLKRADRHDRLLEFRFANKFIRKLKSKRPAIGRIELQDLAVVEFFSERLA